MVLIRCGVPKALQPLRVLCGSLEPIWVLLLDALWVHGWCFSRSGLFWLPFAIESFRFEPKRKLKTLSHTLLVVEI